ncbi:MAG: hypothetical protein R3F30_04010 [Planctomycetota bacterium]
MIRARLLFRNLSLNPRDRFIALEHRPGLVSILVAWLPEIEKVQQVQNRVFQHEIAELERTGGARPLPMEKQEGPLRLPPALAEKLQGKLPAQSSSSRVVVPGELLRPGLVVSTSGDKTLWTMKANLPATNDASDAGQALRVELSRLVIGWFEAQGTLDDQEARTLIAETEKLSMVMRQRRY